jgi:hypothetical protein
MFLTFTLAYYSKVRLGAYSSVALVVSKLCLQELDKGVINKHSSLVHYTFSYGCLTFYNTGGLFVLDILRL